MLVTSVNGIASYFQEDINIAHKRFSCILIQTLKHILHMAMHVLVCDIVCNQYIYKHCKQNSWITIISKCNNCWPHNEHSNMLPLYIVLYYNISKKIQAFHILSALVYSFEKWNIFQLGIACSDLQDIVKSIHF